jgi:hypothetical protein
MTEDQPRRTTADILRRAEYDCADQTTRVRMFQADADAPMWRHTKGSVQFFALSTGTTVVGLVANMVWPYVDGARGTGVGGFLTICGGIAMFGSAMSISSAVAAKRKASANVEKAQVELRQDEQDMLGARAAHDRGLAEKKRLREMPSALDSLTNLVATDSRDWGSTRGDARIFAIICGWDGDPDDPSDTGAWTELAEAYGWSDEFVQKLKDAREAYVYAAAGEAKRRRS